MLFYSFLKIRFLVRQNVRDRFLFFDIALDPVYFLFYRPLTARIDPKSDEAYNQQCERTERDYRVKFRLPRIDAEDVHNQIGQPENHTPANSIKMPKNSQ